MIRDGLWDAFNGYHMGTTAENVAKQWQITRDEQDALCGGLAEQGGSRAGCGQVQGRDRPVTISTRKGDVVVDTDEYIKKGVTLDSSHQAAPGLRQGWHGHRRQRLRHQ
jgi:acetyl-CoA C-acetyltransferase